MLDIVQDYYIIYSFKAHPTDGLEEALDALMDSLIAVESITDPDILSSLSEGTVEVSMYVKAPSKGKAIDIAESALAEAIHNSGGLADWEHRAEGAMRDEQNEAHVRRADLISA